MGTNGQRSELELISKDVEKLDSDFCMATLGCRKQQVRTSLNPCPVCTEEGCLP